MPVHSGSQILAKGWGGGVFMFFLKKDYSINILLEVVPLTNFLMTI